MLQRMMPRRRILMTVDAVGGVWRYAIDLAGELAASGDEVVLAGLGPPPTPQQRDEAEAVATLTWLAAPPDWLAGGEDELAGLADELAHLVDGHAIDIVHLNDPAQAAALVLSCPVVAVSHSCVASWFRAVRNASPPDGWAWQQERTRAGMRRADLLVAPSASHAAALVECYGAVPRTIVVHNATPQAPGPARRADIVFAAGRWWDDGKNAAVLDRAASSAAWPVFAAGATTGPNGAGFAFRDVISLGIISGSQARKFAARCGIFVSPSIYEPFGLAALEAASAGTPLVLADIPTYRELWDDAAVFFPARDADELARQLDRLARDERLRHRLGAAAMQRSRSYTPARQADAMRAVYDEATAVHARQA